MFKRDRMGMHKVEVELNNAVNFFYKNPSLEMVFFEAIMNSIDVNASIIKIHIDIEDFNKPETLCLRIEDNGNGFDNKNFTKFSKLLKIEDENHKGIGRLVFLHYFQKVQVSSIFDGQCRTFTFSEKFKGENDLKAINSKENITTLEFSGYNKKSIKTYDYLKPNTIINFLKIHFFPILHTLKIAEKDLIISISLNTSVENREHNFYNDTKEINIKELPEFEITSFKAENLDLFQDMELHYSINQDFKATSIITTICAEGRTIPLDLISNEKIPEGYQIIFLLYSDYFKGKVSPSRDKLEIEDYELKQLKKLYTKNIGRILNEKIPSIKNRNANIKKSLSDKYPHLEGYFEKETAGLINKNSSLDIAQRKFFSAQKEILESSSLTESQYQKSIELSSRTLMQYILYRTKIINKLKGMDASNSEADIHNIIVPMRSSFKKSNFINDIYANNAWLLDDKFMTYTNILSDKEMNKLISEISFNDKDIETDDTRPDIALIFSHDPNTQKKVDVVIVEVKKLNLQLARKEEVISQLRQRARKLLKYYPNKIERIWFYGIVDIDEEFRVSLIETEFIELFSSDQVFYKEQKIVVDEKNKIIIPAQLYIQSYNAFWKDAESRNATFLKILKESMKKHDKEECSET